MPTIVVIGASRGIGYQFILTLASNPSNTIIATARSPTTLTTKLAPLNLKNVHVIPADLTSPTSLAAAAQATTSLLTNSSTQDTSSNAAAAIDHLILNGAYLSPTGGKNPTDFTTDPALFLSELHASCTANIAGPLFAINAFLPLLRRGTQKRVTYVSSGVAGLDETLSCDVANSVPYVASKAGGNLVVGKFAAELRGEGFLFLSVAPGAVATETLMDLSAHTEDEQAKFQSMLARMQEKYPKWKGPVSPEESVKRMLAVVENATLEQSGQFLSYWGNTTEWL